MVATTFASWTCLPLHSTLAEQFLQAVRDSGVFGQEGGLLSDGPHVANRVFRL